MNNEKLKVIFKSRSESDRYSIYFIFWLLSALKIDVHKRTAMTTG